MDEDEIDETDETDETDVVGGMAGGEGAGEVGEAADRVPERARFTEMGPVGESVPMPPRVRCACAPRVRHSYAPLAQGANHARRLHACHTRATRAPHARHTRATRAPHATPIRALLVLSRTVTSHMRPPSPPRPPCPPQRLISAKSTASIALGSVLDGKTGKRKSLKLKESELAKVSQRNVT